jgi:uncharacterized OB-fold protein
MMFMRCPHCGRLRWPAKDFCNRCHQPGGEWVQVSGRGRLHTWTIQHHLLNPAFADDLPYAVVVVALEEDDDCRLAGNLRGATSDQLALDLPMEAVFEPANDQITLVHWRPRATL